MPAVQYPFIDIAVHERVKDHFARGEAIVLFSLDLEDVLWANGAGAQLFGKSFVYDLIEEGPARTDVTFRQLAASSAQLRAPDASLQFLIRVASGFQRVPVQAVVERIILPGQVDAILFASPVSNAPLKPSVIARSMLEGFDDPDTHMAVLGAGGEVIASSPSFSAIGLTPATARTLVGMVGNQPDRLIKRPVPTGKGTLPAAIGKVSDEPPLHLLFAVETILGNMGPATGFPEDEPAAAPVEEVSPASDPQNLPVTLAEDGEALASSVEALSAADLPLGDDVPVFGDLPFMEALAATGNFEDETADEAGGDQDERAAEADDAFELTAEADDAAQPEQAVDTHDEEDAGNDVTQDASPMPETAEEPVAAVEPDLPAPEVAEAAPAADVAEPDAAEPEPAFVFNPAARPTRFVWKVDADGQFSEISPELAIAVGPHAAALAGQAFSQIADRLHLDPDGKIAELLGKRDTWSGKTIYWPIERTALRAPVDLAALPTYRRNREFDGFRGFGIVRISDAVEDDEAIGMTLVPNFEVAEVDAAEEGNPLAVDEQTDGALEVAAEADTDDAGAEQTETTTDTDELDRVEPEALADLLDLGQPDVPPADDNDGTDEAAVEPAQDVPDVPPSMEPVADELPVFKPVDTPQRQPADKIIKLDERRQRSRDVLSPGEQEAFREIARQLEPFRRSDEDETSAADEAPKETLAGVEPEDASGGIELPPSAAWDVPAESAADAGDVSDETTHEQEEPGEPLPLEPASSASESEQLEILASFIPARTAMAGGLTGEVIDEIPVALLIHAGDRLIHANAEFLRLSGYGSLADLEAVGGLDALLHHKDLEDMPDHSGGLSLVRADDELIPVTARLQSVRWEDNNALLLALIPSGLRPPEVPAAPEHDVDEERLLSRIDDLQVEVDELRSILETATDGVVILGNEGEIRSMNRSASALFDYDEAETRGKPFVMLFAHESHRAVADYLSGMTGHGVASVLNDGREVIGREASGGFIPLFMTIGKLSASNGFCAVIRDITQWKRSEEDLKSAKRAAETANAHKTDFLARVSHEIRTPLNAIIGFSDMMAIEHFGPIGHPRYVEYANDIARSGRLVLDIVNDLLDISKIEAGEMDLEFTAVELNEAVSEAVSLVQPQAHNQRVIIRTAFSDAVPDVVADLRSVKQIVLNILANAIRFTQAGGQIVVSTAYEPSGSVVLRIRDTGVGMTRAELEQAMKPFRQVTAGAGARKRGDGTGLGLPLTKAMVDANRANFTIHSAPNEGTLVEITFPSPRVLAN